MLLAKVAYEQDRTKSPHTLTWLCVVCLQTAHYYITSLPFAVVHKEVISGNYCDGNRFRHSDSRGRVKVHRLRGTTQTDTDRSVRSQASFNFSRNVR
jgi:hypothetical protein